MTWRHHHPLGLAADLARVLQNLPRVEWGRRHEAPKPLLAKLKGAASSKRRRSSDDKERLQQAIRWVDACCPGGRNCFRRALLEIALDQGSAQAPLMMGFRHGDPQPLGHAWIGEDPYAENRYDVIVEL